MKPPASIRYIDDLLIALMKTDGYKTVEGGGVGLIMRSSSFYSVFCPSPVLLRMEAQ